MILKEGISHMATEDMVSWWPFLCFTVLFYGLIPRLILLVAGYMGQTRAINQIDFVGNPFDKVLRQMKTPIIDSKGSHIGDGVDDKQIMMFDDSPAKYHEITGDGDCICLIPGEILDSYPRDSLSVFLSETLGETTIEQFRFGDDGEQDQETLREIARFAKTKGPYHVFILREAWQPPIKEDLMFIRGLREILGKSVKIKIGLIGLPRSEGLFHRAKDEEWMVWDQKIKSLGDPYLSLERLLGHVGK